MESVEWRGQIENNKLFEWGSNTWSSEYKRAKKTNEMPTKPVNHRRSDHLIYKFVIIRVTRYYGNDLFQAFPEDIIGVLPPYFTPRSSRPLHSF